MNQSINTDSKNSKEPQQKYRLGTVSIKTTEKMVSVSSVSKHDHLILLINFKWKKGEMID